MPVEIGLWRIDGEPSRVAAAPMPLESRLEKLIEAEPAILGEPLLFIGRQVPTAHGKFIDLLGVDGDGDLHVLELKRDKTPREVVAQALDYGSWIETLGHDDVVAIFEGYKPGVAFEEAFSERFGSSPPDELNGAHRLTVVASEVDAASARIVEYLARYDVPINVLFFRYFVDGEREYLARSWLVDDVRAGSGTSARKSSGSSTKEPWNGQDWYVSFGEESSVRSWDDARKYGFVSAGGGRWFSRTLRSLPVGARVFACIPQTGYVGVGTVTGAAMRFDDAYLPSGDVSEKMEYLALQGTYRHDDDAEDNDEYIVPVEWTETLDRKDAVWKKGFFANQNSACKLRSSFTLEGLYQRFGLDG